MSGGLDPMTTNALRTCLEEVFEALGDNATQFTCGEAESIAEVYELIGDAERGRHFLLLHAAGDDEGDMHVVSKRDEYGNPLAFRYLSEYEVMPEAQRVEHTCWTGGDDYDGTLVDGCPGCEQAAEHQCQWCGYGGAFTTHHPEAHVENGDPYVGDPNSVSAEWVDYPHLYNVSTVTE